MFKKSVNAVGFLTISIVFKTVSSEQLCIIKY